CAATLEALRSRRGGLRPNDLEGVALDTWIGRVAGVEDAPLGAGLAAFDCRNNRLAALGLRADGFEAAVARARGRYGAERIALLLGTTTSGIAESERAFAQRGTAGELPAWFRYRETHNLFSVCDFVQRQLGLRGPATTISTACSSSAKVFASAQRLVEAGLADAAVVGGVDSLCLMTLYGFNSLQLLSSTPCRPCDAARDGLSIGEAAGFALLEPARPGAGLALLGYGESSDAYHMSSPHPDGEGAAAAMRAALERAGAEPAQVDYVNLHGTGTPANDRAEDAAAFGLFGAEVACSSTKGWTGHALGAAGIVEAVISLLCLRHGLIPGSLNLESVDPALKSRIAVAPEERPLARVLSNSFGFGGNNCSLLFGTLA
ncbi:MAG TPA: beta-ketoacyl-[acyl-carrier-protein] synthase family protein, partial [Burkholderiales bacterium]|nr:beta-ketoacyl-[acyl-carrier-protein] synthase family protein [Burkholderiales bacterium]